MATHEWRAKNPGYQQKYMAAYRKNNPEISLKHNLKKYGLSVDAYKILIEVQNNRCLICGEVLKVACVDHDHKTGRVRGLLCRECNALLGFAKEDITILQNGINYLTRNC